MMGIVITQISMSGQNRFAVICEWGARKERASNISFCKWGFSSSFEYIPAHFRSFIWNNKMHPIFKRLCVKSEVIHKILTIVKVLIAHYI